ncbi:MAG: PRK06851 family protein [Clostridia bacterium]|jgi:chloramphenicol 3-O-phosphotransferase|nr:PRK06851 family protein [Clostridia bacterium]
MSIKKVFPGGNTSKGFYSFYQYLAPIDATKIYVIKGGPGVGKSSMMKAIGQAVAEKGFLVEFHCCSSDNNSIDGIYIPSIKVAMVDGTAPHIVDPKNPGAVDTIVHLGDYWDEEKMRKNRAEIIATNKSIGQHFKRAYHYLAAAQIYRDAEECYYVDEDALDVVGLNALAKSIINEALGEAADSAGTFASSPANVRHLFASAISPNGLVNSLDTIFANVEKKLLINGDPGTGKGSIMKKLVAEAAGRNISMEVYHCALNPEVIEHVLIPELKVGIITSTNPHFTRSASEDLVFDTAEYVDASRVIPYHEDMALARDNYNAAIEHGVSFISRAKVLHDKLEEYYVPNMDFKAVNKRKEEIMQEILGMLS